MKKSWNQSYTDAFLQAPRTSFLSSLIGNVEKTARIYHRNCRKTANSDILKVNNNFGELKFTKSIVNEK